MRAAREQAAEVLSRELERIDGGHSLARHGATVSDAALEARLTRGITPDGKVQNAPPASTRFSSHEDWLLTRQSALDQMKDVFGVDLSKPPALGNNDPLEIIVEFSRAIDEGVVGIGNKVRVIEPTTNRNVRVFQNTSNVDGITRTKTTVQWSDAANQWEVKQHIPWAIGWDDAAKAYDDQTTVHVGVRLPK